MYYESLSLPNLGDFWQEAVFLLILCFVISSPSHGAVAVTHSLQYFYTATSGISAFPEFVTVGVVDGQTFSYYDSNIKKMVAKLDWIHKNEVPEYWRRQTQISVEIMHIYKIGINVIKDRFNQTDGVHIIQRTYGYDWDDETGEVKGHDQYGYDGENFIAFDPKTESWIAAKQQAVITKQSWENDKILMASKKNYFSHQCPGWLKKYVNYGRSSLMRRVSPSVSLLQKSSSSPISCHATGFYPDRAELLWRRDGEEILEGVEKGQILPNNDGTFQMSVDLQLPSAEEMQRYECVFQLSGVKDDKITKLEKPQIRTNEESFGQMMVIVGVIAAVIAVVLAVSAFILYKKKNAKRPPSPVENKEVQQQMLPEEKA